MLKVLVTGFVLVASVMLATSVYYVSTHDTGPGGWALVAIWAAALVLVPGVAVWPARR